MGHGKKPAQDHDPGMTQHTIGIGISKDTLDVHRLPSGEKGCFADEVTGELRELYVARTALIKDRTATLNRQNRVTHALLQSQIAARLRQIDKQLAAVENAIKAAICNEERTRRRFDILLSIPGVSKITAFAIITERSELGNMTGQETASLAGSAPGIANPENGREKPASVVAGPASGAHSICQSSSTSDTTRISSAIIKDLPTPKNQQKSL